MNKLIGILGLIIGGVLVFGSSADSEEISDYRKDSRGIKNNNPGNLVKTKDKWLGLSLHQTDSKFFQFIEAEYGIRAMTKVLNTYFYKHDLKTVQDIINRYAPKTENETDNYITFICENMGIERNDWLSFPDSIFDLVDNIIQYENGMNPYSFSLMNRGIEMAKD